MVANQEKIVHRPLFTWVFKVNFKLQLLLLVTVVVSVITSVVPLEMQKRIVNEAIERRNVDLLVVYCTIYFVAFVMTSGLKYSINALQTLIGQNTLAAMRRQFYDHLLRLPQDFFRNTQSGLIVASLVTELATAGDFVGMAVAVPLVNLLTLVAFGFYLFWLDPLLAAVSFSIYPLVVFLVPKLQKRVNAYNRKRVDATRSFSGRLGESVDGIHEIKANGAFSLENENLGALIERLRTIRIKWNLCRFAVKVVNSLLTNFSRFLIFALGGYLALEGQLALGALVAFISAQEKLYDPWKELIAFYQAYQTATVTYARTRDFFDYQTDSGLRSGKKDIDRLEGRIEVDGLSFQTMEGTTLLQDVSFTLQPGQHMALVGGSGSGKSTLIHCLMGLQPIAGGRYDLDGRRLSDYSRRDLSANMGFVFQDPAIFTGSLEENLLYACQARAKSAKDEDAPDLPDLNTRIEMLQQTDLFSDVLGFGLAARFDPAVHEHLREAVLALRREFRDKFASAAEAEHIEIYAPQRFLRHASVAENLLFGRVTRIGPSIEDLPGDSFFAGFLRQEKLWAALLEWGARLAEDLIEKRDHRFIPTQRMPVAWEELAYFRKRRQKSKSRRPRDLSEQQQRFLISMALRYIPAVHQLTEIPEDLRRRIVACRSPLKRALQRARPAAVRFYHPQAYIEDASIQANILFGRITTRDSEVVARINTRINRLLVEEELLEAILAIGMQYQVGSGGEKLSGGQRQKLALARSLLKQPSILLLDEATASLDNKSQDRVQKALAARWKGNSTLVAVVHRLDIIKDYDQIAVMESGRIAEMGAYDELMEQKGRFYQLVQKQHSV